MEIVELKTIEFIEEYFMGFHYKDAPGSGYNFPCDRHGNLLESHQQTFFSKCISDPNLIFEGVQHISRFYKKPAVGHCCCGQLVSLGGFTNTCHGCGRDYNWNGTLLADRSQWGEETGEHPADIARIP